MLAKTRVKAKHLRVSRKIYRKNNSPWSKSIVLGLLVLVVIVGSFLIFINQNHKSTENIALKTKTYSTPLRYTPLISPYPSVTITITPTPSPLTGFCLHVPILTYHHIQPEAVAKELGQTSLTVDNGIFDQQMAYLVANGYTPIFANELINALLGRSQLPGKPVMVTMDDGYADNAVYALPVLQKYNIKANLMLASGLVGGNPDMLTWDHYPIVSGSQSKIDSEIDTAQTQIQDHTGQAVNVFTYPYGSFNNNAIETLQKKGYIGAYSTIPGQYQCDSFIMTLHRTRIGNAPLSAYGI